VHALACNHIYICCHGGVHNCQASAKSKPCIKPELHSADSWLSFLTVTSVNSWLSFLTVTSVNSWLSFLTVTSVNTCMPWQGMPNVVGLSTSP
jgi:hypothetical protein